MGSLHNIGFEVAQGEVGRFGAVPGSVLEPGSESSVRNFSS